jgi:uncharacterized membrane protein
MWGYQKHLLKDVKRWRTEGWIGADGERKILDDIAARGTGIGLPSALAVLASVLLGFAAISFVAAHWADMARSLRLILLLSLIAIGYAIAAVFDRRGQKAFSEAAILFAIAMFGASIMLISQMFHIDGNPPDGVLLWMLGAIFAGWVLQSHTALAIAMVLAALWSGMHTGETGHVHWPFLIAWSVIAAGFAWQRWLPGLHVAGLALAGYIITLGFTMSNGHQHGLVATIGLLVAGAALAADKLRPDTTHLTSPALGYGIAVSFVGLFALQFIERTSYSGLILIAAITLALLLGAIGYGLLNRHRGAVWLGYIGFSIEILALYGKTLGTILDTSFFFLVAGLIVAGLAAFAWRLAARTQVQEVAA